MKPIPIWEKWIKNPEQREKLFKVIFFLMILVNVMIVVGFVLFVWFMFNR
jgi:F0F1-type ATP synthase membrane subunit c/vacuolar-type H+-ATPase subunit K